MIWYHAALAGALGAVLPDLIKIIRKRFQKRPVYLGRAWYWFVLLIMAGIGAAVSSFKGPSDFIEAMALGAAAPVLIERALAVDEDAHLSAVSEISVFQRARRWWGS
ncbi:hypothetical protein [Roseibium album]|uniref:hypothetical protein n=1 Tax=Roseibium album TaxID=311410 RepID=UPI003BAE399D